MIVSDTVLDLVLRGLVLAAAALLWIVLLVRIAGLRSLSKLTVFDFVMTIAQGSLLAGASQATSWVGFAQSLLGMAALFFLQWLAALVRRRSRVAADIMQNEPLLLMREGTFLRGAMESARITENEIIAKLREANVRDLSEVRAVVLETTGDVSVLHGSELDARLLQGVRRTPLG